MTSVSNEKYRDTNNPIVMGGHTCIYSYQVIMMHAGSVVQNLTVLTNSLHS